jgi:glutaredoxin/ribosomal protein L37AE/L43A
MRASERLAAKKITVRMLFIMPTICPKCNYARKESDTNSEWQCPSCPVAYNKVGDTQYSERGIGLTSKGAYRPQIERSSNTWKWLLAAALVVGIGRQSNLFSKRAVFDSGTDPIVQPDGQPTVILYSASWCGYCRAAREFFIQNGIAYSEHDMEKSAAGIEGYRKLGGGGVPIILIGGEKIRGFSQAQLQQRLEPWIKKQ